MQFFIDSIMTPLFFTACVAVLIAILGAGIYKRSLPEYFKNLGAKTVDWFKALFWLK